VVGIGEEGNLKRAEWLNILLVNSVFVSLDGHCNDYRFSLDLKTLY